MKSVFVPPLNGPTVKVQEFVCLKGGALSSAKMTVAVCEEPGASEPANVYCPSAPAAGWVCVTGNNSVPSMNSRMLQATTMVYASVTTSLYVLLSRCIDWVLYVDRS